MLKKHLFWLITLLIWFVVIYSGCWLQRSSLSIEAQVIYNMGGAQPVARQKFYLLSKDPFTIKPDDPKVKEKSDSLKTEDEKLVVLTGSAVFMLLQEAVQNPSKIQKDKEKVFLGSVEAGKPFWDVYLVKETQTDFKGQALFEDIPAGEYWLLAQAETRAAFTLWNLKVLLKPGENKLLLDQNNALFSK